jgi:capsule biosynthesis phosphatase
MNIIIPIGGVGQRFKDEGYDMPKPLVNVLGKPMIYKVIENINISLEDNIHIIYHNHLKEYNFETLIKFYFPDKNISFISLDYITKGAAETVLKCLETFSEDKIKENVLLLDCDTFYEEDIISKYKSSKDKNLIFYFNDTNPKPIYSYINLDDNQRVISIKEKIKTSDNANTGAYGFESGLELKQYCTNILGLNKELYTSCVYEKMLEDNKQIYGCEVEKFNCVGTPLQLKIYCNQNKDKQEELRICFDLDNTLVTYPILSGDYTSVLPIQRNIDYLKFLKSLGHIIIIYTARRMKTHKGNIGNILADIGRITFDTLDRFDIPYDEIYFGKPHANFYIDDLAINANSSLDKGLGIYNTDISPRSFNRIEYVDNKVIKHTANNGEVYWYKNIPESISHLFPTVYDIQDYKVTLENIEGVNYSYLYTNKTLLLSDLELLINSIKLIHSSKELDNSIDIYSNYSDKLIARHNSNLGLYGKYEISKEIFDLLVSKLKDYENNNEGSIGVIHGDPVFTNILKTKTGIKFIDMRGKQGDEFTLFGDINYDFAKIYQSLIGYDNILNNIEIDYFYTITLVEYFNSQFSEKELKNIKLITASLLYSLIPLHTESKEQFEKYFKLIKNLI